jgi:predicted enzyme related to lactoylglutathione lyase
MAASTSGFIWYELMTTDVAGAKDFYGHVVGWDMHEMNMPNMTYTVVQANHNGVGGIMPMPAHLVDAKVPAHWVGYIHTSDIDGMVRKITDKHGAIHVPPTEIPTVGRFAVLSDPTGAIFHLLQPNPGGELSSADAPGYIGWRELHTSDWPKAFAFYSTLFGWDRSRSVDMGPMGTYQLFSINGVDQGGMMNSPAAARRCFWLYYFNVDDIEAGGRRITERGGKVMQGPSEVPGGHWVIQATDPSGAWFALVGKKV